MTPGLITLSLCGMFAIGADVHLPAPTGPFPVGRIAYHWTDSSRQDSFSPQKGIHREIMVYVWYPAAVKASGNTAPYLPAFLRRERAIGESEWKRTLGAAYAAVKSGQLRSHARENAKGSASGKKYPVLIFSHGFGETGLTYTALLEDLASHGYVVFAIEHPYDASCVVFPDGRAIPFAQEKWEAALKKPEGAVAYQIEQIPVRAADLRF